MIKITDPNLIAQLESSSSKYKKVTDPNIIAQLEGNRQSQSEQPIQQQIPQEQPESSNGFMHYASMLGGPNPMSIIRLLRSAAQGGVEAGRSISNLPHALGAEGWKTAEAANIGPKNPNLLEEGVRIIAPSAALATATGGGSLLGMMRGGAISGGVLDEENPLFGATLGAGLGAVGKAIPRLIDFARNTHPQKVTNEFVNKYGKEAAAKLKDFTKETWNPINEAGNENIYNKINPVQRETTPAYAKYVEKLRNEPKFESFNDIFAENPNLENTHRLQSEIGKELRHLDKAHNMGNDINWLRYKELSKIRQDLKTDINNYMETLSPELRQAHKIASKTHKDIIVPTRNAVRTVGKITSPIDEKVDPQELMSLLKSATKDEKLSYRPLPQEALTLAKQLKRNLGNKRAISLGLVPSTIATGIGYHKTNLLRHLIGR